MEHILKCRCGQYTMLKQCPACKAPTATPRPPKWSPEDKYGKYRRQAKEAGRKEKGLV